MKPAPAAMSVLDAVEAALVEGDMVAAGEILQDLSPFLATPSLSEAKEIKGRIAGLVRQACLARQRTKKRLQEMQGARNGSAQYAQVALSK